MTDNVRLPVVRPRTRAECADVPRPCPFVTCRHHLYVDVSENGLRTHSVDVADMQESCSLDVAEAVSDGTREVTYADVGDLTGLSRALAQETGVRALAKLKRVITMGTPSTKDEPVRVFSPPPARATKPERPPRASRESSYADVIGVVGDGSKAARDISKALGWDHGKTRQVLDDMRRAGIMSVSRIDHKTYEWRAVK